MELNLKKRILVTDGETRAALAVVRSLGQTGHLVEVLSKTDRSLAGASRHAVATWTAVDPMANPERWREQVHEVIRSRRIEVVLPITEASVLAFLEAGPAAEAVAPLPTIESFRALCDKEHVASLAPSLGIAVPQQWVVPDRHWRNGDLPDEPRFPLVVKPSRSVVGAANRRRKLTVSYVENPEQLRLALSGMPDSGFPILLQERICGPGIGVFLLIWSGQVVATFGHRRLREKPPSGGVSVLRESVSVPQALLDKSIALLNSVGWNGVAMVEYKVDSKSGTPFIMEVNGRFWGSLQLAIDAGVDFPKLLVNAALGVPLPDPPDYLAGVQTRWLWGDMDHLILALRGRGSVAGESVGRAKAVWDFFRSFHPKVTNEVLRLRDIKPFFRESADWFGNLRG